MQGLSEYSRQLELVEKEEFYSEDNSLGRFLMSNFLTLQLEFLSSLFQENTALLVPLASLKQELDCWIASHGYYHN